MTNANKKVIIYGLMVFPFFVGFYVANYTKKGCQMRKGIWSSVHRYCITKDCREKEICGKRKNPQLHCDELSIGDSLDSVYFWLGEPSSIKNKQYQWGKTFGVPIQAVVENDKLSLLRCE